MSLDFREVIYYYNNLIYYVRATIDNNIIKYNIF